MIFGTLVHASALTSYWGFPQSGACLPEARGRGGLTLSEARGGGGLLTSSARLVVPDPRATGEEGGCVARIEAAGNKPFPLSLSLSLCTTTTAHTHTWCAHSLFPFVFEKYARNQKSVSTFRLQGPTNPFSYLFMYLLIHKEIGETQSYPPC